LLSDLEISWREREEEANQRRAPGYISTALALRLYALEIRLKTIICKQHPWIMRNIGLVVENVENLDDVYRHFPSDDDEFDLTDMLELS
jgi:hypothetical protein